VVEATRGGRGVYFNREMYVDRGVVLYFNRGPSGRPHRLWSPECGVGWRCCGGTLCRRRCGGWLGCRRSWKAAYDLSLGCFVMNLHQPRSDRCPVKREIDDVFVGRNCNGLVTWGEQRQGIVGLVAEPRTSSGAAESVTMFKDGTRRWLLRL
jgi:hypothetical protein